MGLVGCGYGSLVPVMMGFATSVGKPRYRGVLVGTYVSGNRVGMFAGPALATAVAGGLGDRRRSSLARHFWLWWPALASPEADGWPRLR